MTAGPQVLAEAAIVSLVLVLVIVGLLMDWTIDRRVRAILLEVDVDGYSTSKIVEVVEHHPEVYQVRFRRYQWETTGPPTLIVRGRSRLRRALRVGLSR